MSQHPDIDLLISLYLSGSASKIEERELEKWVNLSSANREVFERLREIWNKPLYEEFNGEIEHVRDQIWASGTRQRESIAAQPKQSVYHFYLRKFAAVFFICLFGSWLFSQWITIDTSWSEATAWIEEVNPTGQKSSHLLPDGTKVWLNAESRLKYADDFSDTLRIVQLEGEAFFEVAKDKNRPFMVETGEIQTVALGTSFNINAYPENQEVKISLLEGKARVQNISQYRTIILSPGEEVATNGNSNFFKQQFDYDITIGWKEGILIFDGADFTSFQNSIEKWYGVKVEVEGNAPDDWEIRAKYQREDLKNVLQDISFNKNLKFEIQEKKVRFIF